MVSCLDSSRRGPFQGNSKKRNYCREALKKNTQPSAGCVGKRMSARAQQVAIWLGPGERLENTGVRGKDGPKREKKDCAGRWKSGRKKNRA